MSAKRDRNYGTNIAAKVMETVGQGVVELVPEKPLVDRTAALSSLSDEVVYNQYRWVDPAVCKPSKVNARDYDALTYEDCAELIETLKSEGQQRTPAIVRSTGDVDCPYEIVAGLRRHWSISWLRSHNYPDFRYLVDVQKLDDEAAFRLSDLENRARTDITDLERGRSYKAALSAYYDGDRERMAERIGISGRNLVRYVWLAELDPIFIEALGGHRAARVAHAQTIRSEAAKTDHHRDAIMAEARDIAEEQRKLGGAGEKLIPAADVVKRLVRAANRKPVKGPPANHAPVRITGSNGEPIIEFIGGTSKTAATIRLLPKTKATREEMHDAVRKLVDQVFDARQG